MLEIDAFLVYIFSRSTHFVQNKLSYLQLTVADSLEFNAVVNI